MENKYDFDENGIKQSTFELALESNALMHELVAKIIHEDKIKSFYESLLNRREVMLESLYQRFGKTPEF